jgi:pimeloyl-ACP methyl ester carboxylesterase
MQRETPLIFIHGLQSSSQGFKARLLREHFPAMLIPDFTGSLEERMAQLRPLLARESEWVIIGSSFGGLMGTLYTAQHPEQVRRLVLFAPAFTRPYMETNPPAPISTPTVIYHGRRDTVVPFEPARALAERIFHNLTFHAIDDDHMLHTTVQQLDWNHLLLDSA